MCWVNGKTYQAPTCELCVHDRVGGGDGFATGFFYGASPPRPAPRPPCTARPALRAGSTAGTTATTVPRRRHCGGVPDASCTCACYGGYAGLMKGMGPQEALNMGWAHGALLTTFPGDTTMSTVEQVKALAAGGSARIQR